MITRTVTHGFQDTPLGTLTLVAESSEDLGPQLTGLYMAEHRPAPTPARLGERGDSPVFSVVGDQLDEYFRGEREQFTVPMAATGTEFQQRVWAALTTIPYGQTWTYRQLAEALGQPTAVRAVASANSRNPISIVVPCHRVIGSDGSLTGYAGGIDRKRFLLGVERQVNRE